MFGPDCVMIIQSNLSSRTPRIRNNSVYKQIFRTQSVSDDVLCLDLQTLLGLDNEDSAVINDIVSLGKNMGLEVNNEVGLKRSRVVPRDRKNKKNPLPNNKIPLPHHLPLSPSTLLHTTFHLRRQLSSTPPSTYAVNSPPHHLPLTPSTLLLTTFHLCRQLSSSPPSTYAVNSPPHHLPLMPSTLLLTTFHLRRQPSSSPPSTYAVNSPPYRYSKTTLSFRLYLICLVLCLSFL